MALLMMRLLQDVTGVDILGEHKHEDDTGIDEPVEPWTRWRELDRDILEAGRVVILDGAVGTEIERRAGEESMNKLGWSCSANFTYPEVVFDVHMSYLEAGSHILTANTYCTNKNVMQGAGLGSIAEKSTRAAVKLAFDARRSYLKRSNAVKRPILVAGSLSCHPPRQEEGSSFNAGVWPDEKTEVENITEHAKLLAECKVDVIIVEMVWDMTHGERAVKAACDTSLPVILSLSAPVPEDAEDPVMTAVKGQLASNTPLKLGGLGDTPLTEAVQLLTKDRPNIVAVCVHHTPLALMPHAIAAVRSVWSGYLGAYPEHGTFEMPHWNYSPLDVDEFVSHAEVWVQGSDVKLVGGCCGVGPVYIEALAENFKDPVPPSATKSAASCHSPLPVAPVRPVDLESRRELPPPPVLGVLPVHNRPRLEDPPVVRAPSGESSVSTVTLPSPPRVGAVGECSPAERSVNEDSPSLKETAPASVGTPVNETTPLSVETHTADAIATLLEQTSSPRIVASSGGALAAFAAEQPAFTHESPFNYRGRQGAAALFSSPVPEVPAFNPAPDITEDDEAALAALPPA
eukprot:TRINITY_DN3309_c0_g1_i1.p1 TRINITY_DN3309_c0_g1~~TRINITY_DN3309_c0_g1_i1.p1  ORF type:complete len:585 (+),score=115.93 TRINITY_DN3309_c0_g1_i1:39-1757(+)